MMRMAVFPTVPGPNQRGEVLIMTESEPFDFDDMSRRMRRPGSSYWPENYPRPSGSAGYLAKRHGVSPRTVRHALDAPEPKPEQVTRRRPLSVITPIKHLIDPLVEQGLDPKQIWVQLIDDHNIAVPLTPLIHYSLNWHISRTRPPDLTAMNRPHQTSDGAKSTVHHALAEDARALKLR